MGATETVAAAWHDIFSILLASLQCLLHPHHPQLTSSGVTNVHILVGFDLATGLLIEDDAEDIIAVCFALGMCHWDRSLFLKETPHSTTACAREPVCCFEFENRRDTGKKSFILAGRTPTEDHRRAGVVVKIMSYVTKSPKK